MDLPNGVITKVLEMNDNEYVDYISSIVQKQNFNDVMSSLDDGLLEVAGFRGREVERICGLNKMVLSKIEDSEAKVNCLAYNYNTMLVSIISQNNFLDVKEVFVEGIDFCAKYSQIEAGKSLICNILTAFQKMNLPLDEYLYYLAKGKDFYINCNEYREAVEVLCVAAYHFAQVSAYQSAYRAIADAQNIMQRSATYENCLKILQTQGDIALNEGDYECADEEYRKCFKIYAEAGIEPPAYFKANAALVKVRKKDFESAKCIYIDLIASASDEENSYNIKLYKVNLLACHKAIGDVDSIETLVAEIESFVSDLEIEQVVEVLMMLSSSCFMVNRRGAGVEHLKNFCSEVQTIIDQYSRLYYRRGVRERYAQRVKGAMASVGQGGDVGDIIYPIAFCYSNGILDWLSILEWVDRIVKSESVTKVLKQSLIEKLEALIDFGAPFAYGFREKYDDPLECLVYKNTDSLGEDIAKKLDYSLPWREFNEIATVICQQYKYNAPLFASSIHCVVNTLIHHLSSGTVFVFMWAHNNFLTITFLFIDKFLSKSFPIEALLKFLSSLYEYQTGCGERGRFVSELITIKNLLKHSLLPVISDLEKSSTSKIRLVPDFLTQSLPMYSIFLESELLRERMRDSTLVVSTSPAIKERFASETDGGKCIFVHDSCSNLGLAESEKDVVKQLFVENEFVEIDLNRQLIDFSSSPVNVAGHIHFALHNVPANFFSDPFFVSTSLSMEDNSIWLESIQRHAHKLRASSVFLNGCSTGAIGNQNYFKKFLTTENVGLSTIFMLNGRSVVISTQWNEPDIMGYIFAALFYRSMSKESDPVVAFNVSLAEMYDLDKDGAICLLQSIKDEDYRTRRCDLMKSSREEYPFRNTYISSMFKCGSLL